MENTLTIMMIGAVAMVLIALIASALEKILTQNFGEIVENGINDLKVNAAFRERWDHNPHSILYTWRQLLFDLQNMRAPHGEIEAVKRQLKHYERCLKKPQTLVNGNGLVKKTTIGGQA